MDGDVRPVGVDRHEPPGGRRTDDSPAHPDPVVGDVPAAFGRWLTRHEIAPERRRRYCERVEHYLGWRAVGSDPHADRTQWRYLALLRRGGADEDELALVRTSLALFSRHQITARRSSWTRRPP